jgi:hypothetical protein
MKKALQVFLLLLVFSGCAYNQSVNILGEQESLVASNNIEIIDYRPESEKSTKIDTSIKDAPARRYGDSFIEPNKLDYLHHVLSSKLDSSKKIMVTLTRFDTIEYLPGSIEQNKKLMKNPAAVFGGAIGALIASISTVKEENQGDNLVMILGGTVNGQKFTIYKLFNYSDLSYVNFPSENPEYAHRLKAIIDEAATEILSYTRVPLKIK